MSHYKFGEFEIDLDVTDVAFVEKYEAAAEFYNEKINNVQKEGKASEQLKAMCCVFFETFDMLLGEGTHEKMFGEKLSVDLCTNAFIELINILKDYSNTTMKMQEVTSNRKSRRAKK